LFRALGRGDEPQDVEVTLVKRIPAQAGLGGGSSDAAATLVALTRLWRSELAPGELLELAARVGSDVPFFLLGGTALALGRGEEIYPLPDLPRRCVVILKPAFGVSTPDAYAWFDEEARQEHVPGAPEYDQEPGLAAAAWVLPCLGAKAGVAMLGLRNDLERGVGRRHPDIAQMKAALRSAGAEAAAMAGSGSAVFGLFRTRAAAAEAAAKLGGGAWKVFVTRTLPRQAGFV
jgi:4-diphosphocytidyl-2-C-methyl-D-erythritol kinase